MAEKRLLFIAHTDNLKGGGELSLVELIKSAKKRGYDPYVVVPGQGEFAEKMDQIGVEATTVKYFYWGRPYSAIESSINLIAVKKIAELINQLNIDCVITNTLTIPWGALTASMTDTPHIWITRETLTLHRGHLHDNYDFIDAFSNIILANSKDNAAYLRKTIGLKNVKQFYSYVDIDDIHLNSRLQKPRIVNVAAHLRPSKDQFELVQALAELEKRKQLKLETVFIANYSDEDEYYQQIKSFIALNQLKNKVSFAGFHSEPFKLVGPNDIFVRPSKYESLGRSLTEAMKLGLICVAADIDSSKEAFELGGGALYQSGSPEDLADVLQKILNNPKDFKKLAGRGKKRALHNLSEEACHDPFFKELDRAINQPNPRRELRHVLPYFSNLLGTLESLEETIAEHKEQAERLRKDIENITSSKAWKTVLFARKVLRR